MLLASPVQINNRSTIGPRWLRAKDSRLKRDRRRVMGSFKKPHAFDPVDLEIIERAYEGAWAMIATREPCRDTSKDEERKKALRRRTFALVCYGISDVETLRNKILASMPEYWT
jgi:hypothetical protein